MRIVDFIAGDDIAKGDLVSIKDGYAVPLVFVSWSEIIPEMAALEAGEKGDIIKVAVKLLSEAEDEAISQDPNPARGTE